jgi:hypothetical protein
VPIHLSRDYVTQYTTTASRGLIPAYLLAIFMRRVLGYSYVGDTNFPINGVGTLLIVTGDTTPTAAPTWVAANMAGINNGAGTYHVTIPAAVHTVAAGDVGRILSLKSTTNPTFNSGLFLITAIDTPNNAFVIDWRSTDTPPAETQTLQWYLYEKDANSPATGGGNGIATGYQGQTTATTPRIILQSPHATAWQARITVESTPDLATGIPYWTVAPGFGGNASGDFPVGGRHLHGALWFNTPSTTTPVNNNDLGMTVGAGDNGLNMKYRVWIIGDTGGQSVAILARDGAGGVAAIPFSVTFGLCDNEPTPLPLDPVTRLYVSGSGTTSGSSPYGLNQIQWAVTIDTTLASFTNAGTAFSLLGTPIPATPSTWTFVTANNAQGNGPFIDATQNPGDSPFISATELLSVEIVAGGIFNWNAAISGSIITNPVQNLGPRTLGTVPFLRQGRANFGNFTTTTDAGKAWLHHQNGVYMAYGGPTVTP